MQLRVTFVYLIFLAASQTCNEAAVRSQTHLYNCLGDNPDSEIFLKTAALSVGAWKDWPEYWRQIKAFRDEIENNLDGASRFGNISSYYEQYD